jgi:hypothetical protein
MAHIFQLIELGSLMVAKMDNSFITFTEHTKITLGLVTQTSQFPYKTAIL